MLRNIFLNRIYIAGVVFFGVLVGSSLLYSWHIKRDVGEIKAIRLLRQIENSKQEGPSTETSQLTEQTGVLENSEVSVEQRNTPQSPNALPDNVSKPNAAPAVEILAETSVEIEAEAETAEKALSIEELGRQKLLQQRASIHEQLKTLLPGGRTVHSSDDRQTVLQGLALIKQLAQIDEALNGYTDHNRLRAIDRAITNTKRLNAKGQLPVSAAEKIADSFQKEGKFEAANRMRLVIQNARENGDAVIKPEHLTVFQ